MTPSRTLPRTTQPEHFSTTNVATPAPGRGGSSARARWGRWALAGGLWLAVALMLMPAAAFGGLPPSAIYGVAHSAAHATPAQSHVAPPAPTAQASSSVASHASLPGQTAVNEKAVDIASLAHQILPAASTAAVEKAFPVASGLGVPSSSAAAPPSGPTAPLAPAAPHPGLYIATGSFYGYVYDRETLKPIQGATVEGFGANGQNCPPSSACPPVSTNSTGGFTVYGPVGFDYVRVSDPYHLDNITYGTAGNGTRTNLGTIYLVQTSIVTGIVKSDTPPSDVPIYGVVVDAVPIDLSYLLSPTYATLTNGSFQIAGGVSPSIVSFTPPAGLYLSNFTWMNGTPGEHINLGTIYLERLTEVKVNLTDGTTGGPLPAGLDVSLQICSLANGCGATSQGLNVFSQNGPSGRTQPSAFATPGYDYALIEVQAYIEDKVTLPLVPKEPPGHVWWMPPQNITPTGGVTFEVGMDGNDAPSGPGTPAHTGLWTVTSCTMSGFQMINVLQNPRTGLFNTSATNCVTGGCLNVNQGGTVMAPPLRGYISIAPDTTGVCGMGNPQWPIPGYISFGDVPDIPVWGNISWQNVTPHLATPIGWLNLTAGTYVSGNVTVAGTNSPPPTSSGGFGVTITSTEYPSLNGYAFSSGASPWASWACGSQPSAGTGFCAPAPPGPDYVTVQALGFPNNYSWVATPEAYVGTPAHVYLGQPENGMKGRINLTAGGFIIGNVTQAGTTFGLPLAAVSICSVSPTYPIGCANGAANLQGKINFPSPLGWDYVKVSAAGYQPDFVWAYVNGSQQTTNVGNIGLQPVATLAGKVVDPNGNPVLGATAQVCALESSITTTCPNLGAGRVGSDGVYLGTVIGGWLPIATYKVVVTAAGYSTDWAWVNATAGNVTNVSTMVLFPSGQNLSAVGGAHRSSGGSSGNAVSTWVVGRYLDNVTGWGVQTGSFQACPAAGGPCIGPSGAAAAGTNTGGYFNLTVPAGLYYLNDSSTGYTFSSVFFNSSGAAYLNLGDVHLQPLPWVFGKILENPWSTLYIPLKSGSNTVIFTEQLGPLASVKICTAQRNCAPISPAGDSANGSFVAWGIPGAADTVTVTPSSPAASSSATGAFVGASTVLPVAGNGTNTTLRSPVNLSIFASVTFSVWNNITWKHQFGLTPMGVRYAGVSISTLGNNTASVGTNANGAGNITFFIPPGNPASRTFTLTTVPDAWETATATLPVLLTPGEAYEAQNLSPVHFGWLVGSAVTNNTYLPAAYLGVSATSTPLGSGTVYTSTSNTNGAGFFNISVAPTLSAKFTIGPGNDYDQATFYDQVNYSNTSALHSVSVASPGNITIQHWGYLSSPQVNYSLFPTTVTVLDQAKQLPVWDAALVVSTTGNTASTTTSLPESNAQGQFFVDAPPGADWANYSRSSYEPNATRAFIQASLVTTVPVVNLTGDGVVAARVVSEPGNVPVSGANITDCLGGQRVCGMSQTNATGVFWVNATPGVNFINVTANGFVSAGPTLANVCSDCFVPLSQIPVYEPAYISGVVRGLPTGLPIQNANVSACSPIGNPVGPCLYSVQTSKTGSFLLIVPAGAYELAIGDPNYNSTYLSLHVQAGQRVSVGTVFLEAFGQLAGAAYNNVTVAPLIGAQVLACPVWSGGTCVPATTGPTGRYLLYGPPGPYVVTVTASGFADALVNAVIVGGRTTIAPTAFLNPLGQNAQYPVTGVVSYHNSPLSGATVAILSGTVVATSTTSASDGSFALNVYYGSYTLLVTALGKAPLLVPLTVHGAVNNLRLSVSDQTYAVSGIVTDGLTTQKLANVEIYVGPTLVATTNDSGAYTLPLANGSWVLTATYAGSGVNYGQVQVLVQVNGAPVDRPIQMYPFQTLVFGLVVDSASGAGLGGAGVTIRGVATDGKALHETFTASSIGAFQVSLPDGQYTVSGVYGGYANATVTLKPSGASTQLVVPLASTQSVGGTAVSPTTEWEAIGVAVGLVAAAGVVAVFLGMRRSVRRDVPANEPSKPAGK